MKNQLRQLWTDNKGYFLAACFLFILGGLIGYWQAPAVEAMVKELLGQLQEIVDRIEESGGGVFATFWMIFSNNVVSALMMMALGLFFALFPIIGLVTNGILLGFILANASGVSPWLMLAAGILPHGIFELPAVLFAAGVGMRLGVLSFRSVGVLIQPHKAEKLKNDWYDTLKQFPAAVLLVIGLLLVAGIVESSITPYVMHEWIGGKVQLNLLK
ncbi:stage II sporulation protein M [Brevibacillus sp. GCM10020057]|uniref:stage II sporulation protein M n=1 Tax=Brevibacillus sp. GCM10020057 TaxID=3317327 RepID=UPI003637453F